jgi:excisionase family DNA binding protein
LILLYCPGVAAQLRVSVRTVRRLGKAGHLEEIRVSGNSVRVTAARSASQTDGSTERFREGQAAEAAVPRVTVQTGLG